MKRKSLVGSTLVVSLYTFISRILGLGRDIVLANFFGAGVAMDAFSVAFRIPNLFRRLFGEGAFNQAFVPVFSEYKTQQPENLKQFTAEVSGMLILTLGVLTLLGIVFAPQMVILFASGFKADPEKFTLSVLLLRLMFPYVFFICLTAMLGSVLNTYQRFAIPAFTPALLNICIMTLAFLSHYFSPPIMAIAVAVLIAGILQALLPFWQVYRLGLVSWPRINWRSKGVNRVIILMVPALIGSSSSQINLLINTQLASRLPTGSVTWLYYSDRLVEFALGTIAVALGTVVLPRLSLLHAETKREAYGATINWSMTIALVIGLPSSIALMMLAEPLLALLFVHGAFTPHDAIQAARSQVTYSTGILAFFIIKILAPVYYSRQDTKTPVKYALYAIALNIVLQLILSRYFAHAGLALSSALAAWLNAILLMVGLQRQGIHNFYSLLQFRLWAVFPANISLVALLYSVTAWSDFWWQGEFFLRLLAMLTLTLTGIVMYFMVLHCAGLRLGHLKRVENFVVSA